MPSTPAYKDSSEATFEADVIERSKEVPVVVDFWAEWCAPCRALGPVLERLAEGSDGAWELVKVDVDQNPALAQAFGVRGIPAVKGFSGGRPVAEFTGAIPEPQVKQWLEQLGPSKGDVLTAEAGRAESSGDLDTASSLYEEALSIEPTHAEAAAGLARVRLAIRQNSLDETSISQRLAEDESDLDAVLGMADIEVGRGDHADAFQRLVGFITISAGDEKEAARQHLLGLLDTLPADDPQVLQARRSLGAALF